MATIEMMNLKDEICIGETKTFLCPQAGTKNEIEK